MEFDTELVLSFGQTAFFAGHPTEEEFAFKWLVLLRKRGDSWQDAKKQIAGFMWQKELGDESHMRQQIDKAEKLLAPWLAG